MSATAKQRLSSERRAAPTVPFKYHFRRTTGRMVVIVDGEPVDCWNIECNVPCQTFRQSEEPRLALIGVCHRVTTRVDDDGEITAVID